MLTLVGLSCNLRRDGQVVPADLATALPRTRGGVLPATWFTGELRCGEGRLVSYVHAGFASGYERDRIFTFEKGRLVSEFVVLNPPSPVVYRIDGDGRRVCVTDPFLHAEELDDPLGDKPFERIYEVWGERPDDIFGAGAEEDDGGESPACGRTVGDDAWGGERSFVVARTIFATG